METTERSNKGLVKYHTHTMEYFTAITNVEYVIYGKIAHGIMLGGENRLQNARYVLHGANLFHLNSHRKKHLEE